VKPRPLSPALLLLTALLLTPALAPAAPKQVTSVEGMTEYRLDNGLKVLLYPDPTRPMVTVNLTVLVGSRHEGYGETGMAHLLEHMLFKGTDKFPNFDKLMTARGARFNGSTWYDRTNYFETLPASDDNLEFAISVEADRLVNEKILPEQLSSEMTVVRSEFEQGENSPPRILWQRAAAVSYEWHNYGKSTIGNRSDIERVPAESLRQFYKKYYQPDNAIVIVAGKFDPAKALSFIDQYFGAIPRPQRQLTQTYTEEPPQDGERAVTLRRVGDVGIVGVMYHVPAGPHEEYPAVEALTSILSEPPAGILYKALVETKKAASVEGESMALHDPGYTWITATVRPDQDLEDVKKTMLATIDKVVADGVTDEQVERAKLRFRAQRKREMIDPTQLAVGLSEWAAQGDWRLFFLMRDRMEKLTAGDVHEAAKKYLRASNRTLAVYVPTKESDRTPVPPPPDVASLLKDYKGREAVAAGEQLDPDPMKLEARVKRVGPIEGVKVALLPKKSRQEMAIVRLTLRYGNEENLKGFVEAADFLPTLMTRGTQKLTRQQLQDQLDKLEATLSGGGDTGTATFAVQAPKSNLPKALELLRQVLREPTLPADEFDILKREQLADLEESRTEPSTLAGIALQRKLQPYPKDDVRYVPTVDESIERTKALTLEQVKKLYADFLGAGAGEMTVVGEFDPEPTLSLIRPALQGWRAKQPYARITEKAAENVAASADKIETPDKANATYVAGFGLAMDDLHPDYPALVLANHVFGGTSAGRLFTRVREHEGLSYGVFSNFRASMLDPSAHFRVSGICNPTNMDKVKQLIAEEFLKIAEKGVTGEELAEAKRSYLESRGMNRTQDRSLGGILAGQLYAGRTMRQEADLEAKLKALTPEQVSAAVKKYYQPDRLVVVTAGDFADASKYAGDGKGAPAGAGK
jgi:zinc protease